MRTKWSAAISSSTRFGVTTSFHPHARSTTLSSVSGSASSLRRLAQNIFTPSGVWDISSHHDETTFDKTPFRGAHRSFSSLDDEAGRQVFAVVSGDSKQAFLLGDGDTA